MHRLAGTIHLEAMTFDDLDEVLALENRAFPDPWTRAQFEAELTNPHADILLARRGISTQDGGAIVGYLAYWHILDEIQILDIAVDPDMRRQGIARMLLTHVLNTSAAQDCVTWSLEVRASNDAARQLYEGAGFRVVNTRPGYYAHGKEDALIMVRGTVPGT